MTIPANSQTPPSAQIFITTCGDTLDEFDETFAVNLTGSSPQLQIADGQRKPAGSSSLKASGLCGPRELVSGPTPP